MSDILRAARTPWLATPLIAGATFSSLWALTAIVVLDSWVGTTALALAVVAVVVILTRIATRFRVLPSVLGLVAAILVLVPLYARDATGAGFILPTPASLTALLDVFSAGADYAATTPNPPLAVEGPLAAVLTAGLLILFLLAEYVAVSSRSVASAGLLLLLPWVPAIFLNHPISTGMLLVELACWIAAMALSRTNAPVERGVSLGSSLVATIAVVALTVLAAPVALGGTGWGDIPGLNSQDLPPGPTRLNLDLDLRTSLTTNSQTTVLIYVADGPRPDAFRLHTLADFDGALWTDDGPPATNLSPTNGVLWPEDVPGWVASDHVRVDVSILSLLDRSLPLPTSPRTVDVQGDWAYDRERDLVVTEAGSTKNLQYAFTVSPSFHEVSALRAADAYLADNPDLDATDPRYLAIAGAVDVEPIRALAEEVTAAKSTRYDKALAIQSYLRDPTAFTYTTAVQPTGTDAVSAFLESKQGYCVQFASAMVVMLRSLDIPARLGLGFLSGEYDGSTGYVVRGSDAHAWPEVYFPGHGWVRFEPTPSVQSGAPPTWADPYGSEIPVPRDVLEGGGYPTDTTGNSTDGQGGHPLPTEQPAGTPWWVVVVAVIGFLALATTGVLWWRQRATTTRRLAPGPEGSWQRLAEALGSLAWPPSATPGEARAHVLRGLRRLAGHPPGPGGAALTALSSAISDHRYSPTGTPIPQQQLDAWVQEVVFEVETAQTEAKDRPARGASRSAPRAGS